MVDASSTRTFDQTTFHLRTCARSTMTKALSVSGYVSRIIPERLVVFEDGKKFVEVPESEGKGELKTRKVEIQTGLSDGLNIEVLSGLKEGDKVVERPPREIR